MVFIFDFGSLLNRTHSCSEQVALGTLTVIPSVLISSCTPGLSLQTGFWAELGQLWVLVGWKVSWPMAFPALLFSRVTWKNILPYEVKRAQGSLLANDFHVSQIFLCRRTLENQFRRVLVLLIRERAPHACVSRGSCRLSLILSQALVAEAKTY